MAHRLTRLLLVPSLVLTCLAVACKTAPTAESPVATPPAFESGPAERVEETSGFREPEPSGEAVGESRSDLSERLNAQGILKRIHFDFDKYDLRPDAVRTLNSNAGRIQEHSQLRIRIEGHCDERGTVEYNLALGEKRARAARDYLVSQGVSAGRMRIISFGKERPIDPGHNEDAWAMNRRAEFIFLPD